MYSADVNAPSLIAPAVSQPAIMSLARNDPGAAGPAKAASDQSQRPHLQSNPLCNLRN
jgi:hypothetical protein